ncbi:MAG TPA: hypothetical protein VHJ38_01545 [Nitrososphaeraceae archaeon]|nr:hypothetical protein [Nitrososphaeraceae archaeon]
MDLIEEMQHEYELCIKKPIEYMIKVNSISDLLLLKGNRRLMETDCPVFVVGKHKIAPIVMFGINPGYSLKIILQKTRRHENLGSGTYNFMKTFIITLKVTILNHHIIIH